MIRTIRWRQDSGRQETRGPTGLESARLVHNAICGFLFGLESWDLFLEGKGGANDRDGKITGPLTLGVFEPPLIGSDYHGDISVKCVSACWRKGCA